MRPDVMTSPGDNRDAVTGGDVGGLRLADAVGEFAMRSGRSLSSRLGLSGARPTTPAVGRGARGMPDRAKVTDRSVKPRLGSRRGRRVLTTTTRDQGLEVPRAADTRMRGSTNVRGDALTPRRLLALQRTI